MTDAVQIALIAAIPPTVVASLGAWVSMRNSRDIGQVHGIVDGQQKHILKIANAKSYKAGTKAGRASKVRKATKPKS